MSVFWNSRVKSLSPYVPGEQPKNRCFIKLNTNENPYPPSPNVMEAIHRAATESLRLYPDPACTQFREAVAARYHVRPEQVFAGNGSDEVLAFAFGAFFESAASAVFFPDISYSFYPVYAGLWNIPYKIVPLDNNFCVNTIDYTVSSACGGVVFPNPNAPTGIALPLAGIVSLAEHLEKLRKVLIIDEAYVDFSGGGYSAIPRINDHPNLLVTRTLSKSASLAGLRSGFAIGNEKLIEGLCRVRDSFNSYTLDRLALAGAAAAVSDREYYNEINNKVIMTRERVTAALRGLGCTVLPSSANFVFIKTPCISGADFFAALREKGILVRHFNRDRIADFLRVSIGTDSEMDTFLAACAEIIRRHKDNA